MEFSGNIDISRLSAAERILLAQELWDSVHEEMRSEAPTPDQREEMRRRLDELRSGKVQGIAWESLRRSFLPGQ